MELLVCAVHPIPGRFYFLWTTKLSNHGGKIGSQWVPVDVTLSLPMFLRSDNADNVLEVTFSTSDHQYSPRSCSPLILEISAVYLHPFSPAP